MRFSPRRPRAFTLIELLVVLGIVALLLTLAVPRFFPSIDASRETILMENLRNTRAIIDQFHADTGRYPESLEQLVEKKYLRELPMDPILESREGWIVEPPPEGEQGAVGNVCSGAPGNGRKGTPYAQW